jgi:hypothetical protein
MNSNTRFLWFVAWLALAGLIAMCSLHQVEIANGQVGRSVYDGTWEITFIEISGDKTIYRSCRIAEIGDNWVTFTYGGRNDEIRLPLKSGISITIMERER